MPRSIAGFLLIVSLIACGCAPAVMSIEPEKAQSLNPLGVFIIASSQIVDNADSLHRDFTVAIAEYALFRLLSEKGYQVRLLNDVIPMDSVFSKYPFSFYINEKDIARRAQLKGCTSTLIVYFAYAGKLTPLPSDLNVYEGCSLYGWMMTNSDADLLTSSHSMLNSYLGFVSELPPDSQHHSRETYRRFFSWMLDRMFGNLPHL